MFARFKKCSCFMNSESEHEYINNMSMNPDTKMPSSLSQSAPDLLSGGPPNRPPPLPPSESETTDEAEEEEAVYCNSELPQPSKFQK